MDKNIKTGISRWK